MWPNSPAYPWWPRSSRPSATIAAADADLAEDHQDVLAGRVAGHGLGDRGEVALVLDRDRGSRAEAAAQLGADRDVAPAQVGADGQHLARPVEQAGDADGDADALPPPARTSASVRSTSSTSRSSTSSTASRWASRASRCSATTLPARSRARAATWLTLISAPMPQTGRRRARPTCPGGRRRRARRRPRGPGRARRARRPARRRRSGSGRARWRAGPASGARGRAAGGGTRESLALRTARPPDPQRARQPL